MVSAWTSTSTSLSLEDEDKLLIVDDRVENLFATRQVLRDMKLDIYTAESGKEALRLMGDNTFALVLLDVCMPDLDGFETAHLMQAKSGTMPVPIMFVTAMCQEESSVNRGYELGAVDYIQKPVNPDILRNKVKSFLDVRKKLQMSERLLSDVFQQQRFESIGLLAGGIAHDLNNILGIVMGNAQMSWIKLQRGDDISRNMKDIEQACHRATGLTQQLLTFAKKGVPVLEGTSIDALIHEAVKFSLTGSNVNSRCDVDAELWPVLVDDCQINQVLNNLVINARQAMPDGGTVEVRACNQLLDDDNTIDLPAGRYVRIAVADQGVGIAEDELSRIFEPYFTTKPTGNGLGLAASQSIIQQHGGIISVSSTLGEGTCFEIYLQAVDEVAQAVPAPCEKKVFYRGVGRILIMDDQDCVREMLAEMLTLSGYDVVATSHGQEAVDVFCHNHQSGRQFDAVILDLTVPGKLGGVEAVAAIRAVEPHIKAIVATGYANDALMKDLNGHGFDMAVSKPFKISELTESLRTVLGHRKSA